MCEIDASSAEILKGELSVRDFHRILQDLLIKNRPAVTVAFPALRVLFDINCGVLIIHRDEKRAFKSIMISRYNRDIETKTIHPPENIATVTLVTAGIQLTSCF